MSLLLLLTQPPPSSSKSLSLSDSLGFAESFMRRLARRFTDAAVVSDALRKRLTKSFSASVSFSEQTRRAITRRCNDAMTWSAALNRGMTKRFAETLSLADVIRTIFSKAIGAADALHTFVVNATRRVWSVFADLRAWSVIPAIRSWSATQMVIYADSKKAAAIEDFQLDWTSVVAQDTIVSSQWSLPDGLTLVTQAHTTTSATARLSGGLVGQVYTVVNTVTLTSGQVKVQTLRIPVD